MALATQTLTLDLRPAYNTRGVVRCSQYDDTLRTITFLIQNAGVDIDVSAYTVFIEGTKPDNTGFSYNVRDVGGTVQVNSVTVPIQVQMCAVAGMVRTEIIFKNGSERVGSANFFIAVEAAGLDANVDISETEIPAYISAAEQAAEVAQQAQQSAEVSAQIAQGAVDNISSVAIVRTTEAANPLTITDGADNMPVKDLLVKIDYRASGWTECRIVGYSAYPFDKTIFSDADTSIKTKLLSGKPNKTYVAVTNLPLASGGAANVFVSANSTSPTTSNAGVWQGNNRTFTTDSDGIIKVLYRTTGLPSGKTLLDYDYGILESGTGTTYIVNWSTVAGTVYGGTLDITTGVLTSTLASDGSALATPVVYQLTPTEVTTLLQGNVFTSDCGDITLSYFADTKTYIDNAIATAISSL